MAAQSSCLPVLSLPNIPLSISTCESSSFFTFNLSAHGKRGFHALSYENEARRKKAEGREGKRNSRPLGANKDPRLSANKFAGRRWKRQRKIGKEGIRKTKRTHKGEIEGKGEVNRDSVETLERGFVLRMAIHAREKKGMPEAGHKRERPVFRERGGVGLSM